MSFQARIASYFVLGLILYVFILAGAFLFHRRVEDHARSQLSMQESQEVQTYVNALDFGPDAPGSPPRIQAIERGFQPFLTALKQTLRHGKTRDLENLKPPFSDHTFWVVARKSRVVYRAGKSFEDVLKKDWSRHFFMGLHHGGEVFKRKITRFYPRSIAERDFMSYRGAFQALRFGHRALAWYLGQAGNHNFMILVDLNSLTTAALKRGVLALVQEKYRISKAAPSLIQDFLLFFKSKIRFFLGYLVLLTWICSRAWPLLWETRFSARYFLVFASFLILLDLFFIHLFQEFQENLKVQVLKTLERGWRSKLLDLERGLEQFMAGPASELTRKFEKKTSLQAHDWPAFSRLILADREGEVSIHPENTEFLFQQIMVHCIVELIPAIKESQVASSALIKKRYSRWSNQVISFSDRNWDELRKSVLGRIPGVFHHSKILSSSFYLFWLHKGIGKDFKILGAWCKIEDVLKVYFDAHSQTPSVESFSESILALASSGIEGYSLAKPLKKEGDDVEDLMFLLKNRTNLFQEVFWQGKPHYVLRVSSPVLQGYNFLFLKDKDQALLEIQALRKIFFWLQVGFVILAGLSFVLLTRKVIGPVLVLRKGLSRIGNEDLNFHLDESGKDEISQVLSGFNSMVLELRRRKQLLPFIPHDILRLFKSDSGQLETEISDDAVVVFSDIRSFTTISETYEPEEIVNMLNSYFSIWQAKVQKHGGVIEKFIGDAVVVIFFKKNSPHYLHQAVQASVEAMKELIHFNRDREENGLFAIENGVGICAGRIDFGIIGNESKRHFFASGKPVIQAEVLEAESKHGKHTHILTDAKVYTELHYQYDFTLHKEIRDQKIYEILNL